MTRRLYSHYDTLRVDRCASADGVRAAYRRLAQKFHPDKHPGRKAAAVVMAEINLAYEVLSNAEQRAAYDAWLDLEDGRLRVGVRGAVFTPDRFGWAGWLVFATSSLAVLTVGYVVLATWPPGPAVRSPRTAVQQATGTAGADRAAAARAGGPEHRNDQPATAVARSRESQ
jgi:curved DNA-binding protein CbpA